MITIYGSQLCPDCVACRQELDDAKVPYTYLNITDELPNLKAFLKIRDENSLFDEIRSEGKIGIPCILREDSTITFDWKEFI